MMTGERPQDYVFKSEFSRFGTGVRIKPGKAPDGDAWLQQDWIGGEDLSAHAVARNGQLRAFAAYRSRWRAKGGASYQFDPVEPELAQEIEAMMVRLAFALDLTGQFACDLRRDAEERLWLIECNPRATSGLHLLTHDPEGLTMAFTGGGTSILRGGSPACLAPAMWLNGLPHALISGRLGQWSRDLGRSRDVLKGRGLAAAIDTLVFARRAILSGHGLTEAMTADIQCDRDLTCN